MRGIRGLAGLLPPGEHVVWRGAPCWRSLARHLCHVRAVGLYMGLVVGGTTVLSVAEGDTAAVTLMTAGPLAAAGGAVLAFLVLLAWLVARTTEYTLTTHRLVLRFGIALTATLAIPHRGIAGAAVTLHADGTGDLPIRMRPGFHVPLHRAWPHARPWRLARPEPMLRSVPEAGRLAALLARTLAEAESLRMMERDRAGPAAAAPGLGALQHAG